MSWLFLCLLLLLSQPSAPKTVKALICAQNWLKNPSKPINLREATNEVESLEQDVEVGNFVKLYIVYCSLFISLLTFSVFIFIELMKLARRKCTFSPYILNFFHFSPYILFFPLLVPKTN